MRLRDLGRPGSWDRWCRFFIEGVTIQAGENMRKARAIQDLYERLKKQVLDLTHSQFAVPMLDYFFQRPIFRSSELTKLDHMPSAPMVGTLLGNSGRTIFFTRCAKELGDDLMSWLCASSLTFVKVGT